MIPSQLDGIAPSIGSTWMWEPLKAAVSCKVLVTDVRWNGEEVWVESESSNGQRVWNELSRWVEATVLLDPGEE